MATAESYINRFLSLKKLNKVSWNFFNCFYMAVSLKDSNLHHQRVYHRCMNYTIRHVYDVHVICLDTVRHQSNAENLHLLNTWFNHTREQVKLHFIFLPPSTKSNTCKVEVQWHYPGLLVRFLLEQSVNMRLKNAFIASRTSTCTLFCPPTSFVRTRLNRHYTQGMYKGGNIEKHFFSDSRDIMQISNVTQFRYTIPFNSSVSHSLLQ